MGTTLRNHRLYRN